MDMAPICRHTNMTQQEWRNEYKSNRTVPTAFRLQFCPIGTDGMVKGCDMFLVSGTAFPALSHNVLVRQSVVFVLNYVHYIRIAEANTVLATELASIHSQSTSSHMSATEQITVEETLVHKQRQRRSVSFVAICRAGLPLAPVSSCWRVLGG